MIRVLYEDNHIIAAIKPRSMPVQADSSGDEDMLRHLKAYIKEKYKKPGEVYLGLVHRLDRPVGGVMVFARTSKAAKRLSEQFALQKPVKRYAAVVHGGKEGGRLVGWILKDGKANKVSVFASERPGAKRAELEYTKLESVNGLSLLDVNLFTGRPHQIRAQLADAGMEIYGDMKYGGREKGNIALWSYMLEIEHPTLKKSMRFAEPPPDEYPWNIFTWPASFNAGHE
ncbi:MAG: RluA family pseudouridine synthase [Christensenellales bacterium]